MPQASEVRLSSVLEGFLEEMGVPRGDVVLGPATSGTLSEGKPPPARRRPAPSAAQRDAMLKRLESVAQRARHVLWLWAAATVVVLLLAVGMAIYHRDNTTFVGASMLGGSGALMAILSQARAIHSRLVATEVLLVMLPNLPPDEWVRVAVAMLEEFKDTRAPRPVGTRRAAA